MPWVEAVASAKALRQKKKNKFGGRKRKLASVADSWTEKERRR